jgi:hypothetical protein
MSSSVRAACSSPATVCIFLSFQEPSKASRDDRGAVRCLAPFGVVLPLNIQTI